MWPRLRCTMGGAKARVNSITAATFVCSIVIMSCMRRRWWPSRQGRPTARIHMHRCPRTQQRTQRDHRDQRLIQWVHAEE